MRKATYRRGAFYLDLCFDKADGDLAVEDRQCAWELYAEIVTRGAVCGRVDARGAQIFDGELFIDGIASLYEFRAEARALMRRYPVGRLPAQCSHHLGSLIGGMLQVAVQPFLEHWGARFSAWWRMHPGEPEQNDDPPLARQRQYPQLQPMLDEWSCLRALGREVVAVLEAAYGFEPALLPLVPQHVRDEWARDLPKVEVNDQCASSPAGATSSACQPQP